MQKHTLTTITLLLILIPSTALAALSDISGHKNQLAIEYLYENEIISGYADGTFKPDQTVNRAELLKILIGGKGIRESANEFKNCFPDVKEEWFAPYICYAKTYDWIEGYPDGTFKPSQTINKAEAIKMLANSQEYSVPSSVSTYLYDDIDNSAWYAPYIFVAKNKGLLEETGNTYGISEDMTRGSISENIYRAIKSAETTTLYLITQVIDGDTVKLENGEKVRLLGINTPEMSSNDCYAQEAKDYLTQLVLNQEVELVGDAINNDRDVYNRLLRYIYLDNENINKKLVTEGYSAYYDKYQITYAEDFAAAETGAIAAEKGIWSECLDSLPPEEDPVIEPAAEPVTTPGGAIEINYVLYDGEVPYVESDEYVEIINNGSQPQNLIGYKISGSKGDESYTFSSIELAPGQKIKVYTNQGDYSFYSGKAIWNNTGETAYLYDGSGGLVDSYGW